MRFDSPIEQRLFAGLASIACDRDLRLAYQDGKTWPAIDADSDELVVFGQVPLDGYRLDFVISKAGRSVAIECDGHNFHERTKEQAQHDKARDRRVARTIQTLRFTGSEIVRNPLKCAAEAIDFVANMAVERNETSSADPLDVWLFNPETDIA